MNKVFAIIPARAGSKGIPGKNLSILGNETLVGRTISKAIHSDLFDEIFISSECEDILSIGSELGVKRVKRPNQLADDFSQARDVVSHALQFFDGHNLSFTQSDWIVYLQPTSPFIEVETISQMLFLAKHKQECVVSVRSALDSPFKVVKLDESDKIIPLMNGSNLAANRQELPEVYIPTGGCYVFTRGMFESVNEFPINGATPYVINQLEGFDIDTPLDLTIARFLLGDN
jgi:CMP-N-acetylneuraminic acid synthetase